MSDSCAVLRVDSPGLLTTIQDLGRPGRGAAGVPTGGAMDRYSLAVANLLVGNPEGAAGLECLLRGPALVATAACLVAVTGADLGATVNGEELPLWTSAFLAEGDRLAFSGRKSGARAYVAVAGGLAAERWLGSASTYLLVGKGGLEGRQLRAGDELTLAAPRGQPLVAGRSLPVGARPSYGDQVTQLAAVAGPHLEHLAPLSAAALFAAPWTVSREADRMGFRLEGERLDVRGVELVSFGLTMGCVQVPPSGQPILLMADHQTAGGYAVAAAVARAELPMAAQLLPGDRLHLQETTVEAAQDMWRRQRATLADLGKRP